MMPSGNLSLSYPVPFPVGTLKTVREGRGRRPEVLALSELIHLCEGKKVF